MQEIKDIKKERYEFLDLLKFIATSFVIVYHFSYFKFNVLADYGSFSYVLYYFRTILSTCVPIFFIVNGALTLNKDMNLKKHIIKTVRLLIIAVSWAFIDLIIMMFWRHEILSLKQLIQYALTLKYGWINSLWFLSALFTVYVLLPVVKYLYDNSMKYFYYLLAVVFIFTFGSEIITLLVNIFQLIFTDGKVYKNKNFFFFFNPVNTLYFYIIVYFMLGALLFKYKDILKNKKFKKYSLIAIPIIMLFYFIYAVFYSRRSGKSYDVVWEGYDSIFTLLIASGLFISVLSYKGKGALGKIVKIVGENSLGIYLTHFLVIEFIQDFYEKIPIHRNMFVNIAASLVILFLSVIVTLGLRKIPVINKLFKI